MLVATVAGWPPAFNYAIMKNTLTRIPSLVCVAILGLSAATATAKDPTSADAKEYQRKLFKQLDEDGDGKITEKEFIVTVLYAVFAEEAGKDGKLTKKEYFENSTENTAKAEWALMDPNGKGEIEFKDVFKNTIAINDLKKEFRKADKKGRGFITLKEIN